MISMNGLAITEELVEFLKVSFCGILDDDDSTFYDEDVNAMMELNDYFLDVLTLTFLGNTEKVKQLSTFLINIKAARDRAKQLSALLKECREKGVKK